MRITNYHPLLGMPDFFPFFSGRMEAIRDAIISANEEQFSALMKDPLYKEQLSECVLRSHGPNKEFPLYWAAHGGSLYILVYILQAGGNVRQRTEKGWTALHAAASNNRLDVVEELLKVPHADVDALTYNKDTALILAAKQGHVSVVWTLLVNGANKHIKNLDGFSAYICVNASKVQIKEHVHVFGPDKVDEKLMKLSGAKCT
jgi:ankyrin repeat protein